MTAALPNTRRNSLLIFEISQNKYKEFETYSSIGNRVSKVGKELQKCIFTFLKNYSHTYPIFFENLLANPFDQVADLNPVRPVSVDPFSINANRF